MSEIQKCKSPCSHTAKRQVGLDQEGAGTIIVEWCPDCGALKRTMTNWRYTNYPWVIPLNQIEVV